MVCKFCDEKYYVLYGTCGKCGREGQPPLLDIGVPTLFLNRLRKECLDLKREYNSLKNKGLNKNND